jgi:hypothetical protein
MDPLCGLIRGPLTIKPKYNPKHKEKNKIKCDIVATYNKLNNLISLIYKLL